jgi:hypothetical protein
MIKLRWDKKEPTSSGLYKVRNSNGNTFWAYVTTPLKYVQIFGSADKVHFDFITDWLGPWPEPKPPA